MSHFKGAKMSVTFPQCQRCKRVILSETSSAKRIHNVKCLSFAIGESNCDILQGFINVVIPEVTVALRKEASISLPDGNHHTKTTANKPSRKEKVDHLEQKVHFSNAMNIESELPKLIKNASIVSDCQKKKRGRPRKRCLSETSVSNERKVLKTRKPGRPRKQPIFYEADEGKAALRDQQKRVILTKQALQIKRGRPPKPLIQRSCEQPAQKQVKAGQVDIKCGKSCKDVRSPHWKLLTGASAAQVLATKIVNCSRKKSRGRKVSSKRNGGVDVANIIEGSSRPRNSWMKAQEKLKRLAEDGEVYDDADGEPATASNVSSRKRKRTSDDEEFDTEEEAKASGKRRYNKYIEPLSQREKYLIFTKKLNYEYIRATDGKVGARRYRKDKPVKEMTKEEKRFRYFQQEVCTICEEFVRAFYMDQHMNHFHKESHDKDNCECDLDHCKAQPSENRNRVMKALRRKPEKKIKHMTGQEIYARYMRKIMCAFCKQIIREFYVKEHNQHFHTEGHDQSSCRCIMSHCNPVSGRPTIPGRTKKDQIECQSCYKMIEKKGFKKHLALHSRLKSKLIKGACLKSLKCAICNNDFGTNHGLKTHFIREHLPSNPFVCRFPGCVHKSGEFYQLERHVQKHMLQVKLKCKTCKKQFCTLETLLKHDESGTCQLDQAGEKIESEKESVSIIKTEKVINMGSVEIQDKILETENGPIHLKGERLDALPESDKSTEGMHHEDDGEDLNNSEEVEWDQANLRERVLKKILSWNGKLNDMCYINEVIRNDPFFQKLETENEDFTKQVLRGGGRNRYFLPHRQTVVFNHRCNRCGSAFRRGWALQKHIRQNMCYLKSSKSEIDIEKEPEKVERGVSEEDGEKKLNFMCNSCGYQTTSAKQLEIHMKTSKNHHDLQNAFPCPKRCGSVFDNLPKLHAHLDEVHFTEKTFQCHQCPRLFTTDKRRKLHIYNFHNRAASRCQKCGTTVVKENLERHKLTCKLEMSKPKCMQCNEYFCNSTSLRRHVLRVHQRPDVPQMRDINGTDDNGNGDIDCSLNDDEPVLVTTSTVANDDESLIIGF